MASDEPDVNAIQMRIAVLSIDWIYQYADKHLYHNSLHALRSLSALASAISLVNGRVEVDDEEFPNTPNRPNQDHCNDSTTGNSCWVIFQLIYVQYPHFWNRSNLFPITPQVNASNEVPPVLLHLPSLATSTFHNHQSKE